MLKEIRNAGIAALALLALQPAYATIEGSLDPTSVVRNGATHQPIQK